MTLDDAVRFALERNLDIAVQRLNPQLQDIAVATARTFYGPTLTSQLGQNHNINAPTSQLQLSQGGGGVTNQTSTYNAGVTKNFTYGGGVATATLNNSRQATNSNNAFYNPQFDSLWTFSYSQPLLRDFQDRHAAADADRLAGEPRDLRRAAARLDDESRLERAQRLLGLRLHDTGRGGRAPVVRSGHPSSCRTTRSASKSARWPPSTSCRRRPSRRRAAKVWWPPKTPGEPPNWP